MLKLIFKIIKSLNCPAWIIKNNELILFNNELEKIINSNISTIVYSSDDNLLKINNEIIEKTSNNNFIINDCQYSLNCINEIVNEDNYEIYILNMESSTLYKDHSGSSDILRTVIDNVPELIFFKDDKGIYKVANKHCNEFYASKGVDTILGKSDSELPLNKNFIENCKKNDLIVINNKTPLYIEEDIHDDNGKKQVFETVKTPVIDKEGTFIGIIGVAKDITAQKELENNLRYLSYTDSLTGLRNRAYFRKKINELIEEEAFPIKIIMGDVNGLKIVNDTFGHIEGDNLIISMAKKLKEFYDNPELIFRWGGDEFVLLIPRCKEEEYSRLIEKLNSIDDDNCSSKFNLSMSIGSSIINNKNDNLDEALNEAENKLYRQKLLIGKSVRSSILSTLIKTLQVKNVESKEHTERVVNHSLAIGQRLNLDIEDLDELALVAKLHDIGKIGIPEEILLKPSKLTYDEFEIMKTHSEKGYRLIMTLPELSHIARGILAHHEKYDGTGYPLGLSKNEIPLVSRIVSVVDAYDAMTNNRIYNKIKSKSEAIEELQKFSGSQFDPKIVNIFCSLL